MPDTDIFSVSAQGEFVKNLGKHVASEAKQLGMHGDQSAMNPLSAIDAVATSLRDAGVDQEYITAVESIKEDDDIQEAIRIFQDALEGKENIQKIADLVPKPETSEDYERKHVFDIIYGKVSEEGETDLVRFSNELSGSGSTVSGFVADLPQSFADMSNGITNASLFRYTKLQDKLDGTSERLSKLIEENENHIRTYGIDPEQARRQRKGYDIILGSSVANSSKKKVRANFESTQTKLLHETFLTNADLQYQKARHKGRLGAQKMFGKAGKAIQGASGGFGVALGGVDIAAGDEMIQSTERRFRNGEISKSQYDKGMRDARFRISQGAFGIGDGLNNIRQLVMDKVGDKAKKLAKGARMGLRFASVVGGALSIGMGITSIAKNAIAAHDADQSGNVGRAAMFGIMAGLDCVSVAIDAVSMVLDFVPGIGTALSFVVDLANTIVGLVNMVIGFFTEMVDTRTPTQKLQSAFDDHIDSPAFQNYLDNQAQRYKEEGYDLFTFMVDAKALGLEETGADGGDVSDTIVRQLSEKAKADGEDVTLRLALVDASSLGHELEGRENDDKILAGAGRDTLYGHGGDDILFGQAGNDTIYGGPGNDYLNGGASRDVLIGGTGDDFLSYEPGIDILASGGEDTDTLEVTANFFAYDNTENEKALVLPSDAMHRVYVDVSNQSNGSGHGGISLGALFDNVDMLANRMHKPAFGTDSSLATRLVNNLYKRSGKTTVSKEYFTGSYLWYLANREERDYFTDGHYIYSCPDNVSRETRDITRANYDIAGISITEAVIDETDDNDQPKYMAYKTNQLEALFAFAFLTTSAISGVEQICEKPYDAAAPYPVDVNCSVIGDANISLIDIGTGDNEYVYTGDGDTLVMFSLSDSAQWEIWKYIVGGSGNNTLIITGGSRNTMRPNFNAARYQCILLDHDIDLAEANRSDNDANSHAWPANGENKVDRGVFIKNIGTIQFSNAEGHRNTFHADCTNLSSGHRFILNDHRGYLRFIGTAGDDSIMVKRVTGYDNIIDGHLGRNLLSFASFEPSTSISIDIDVPPNHISGRISGSNFSIGVKNIHSVHGNALTRRIDGHSTDDNLLMANGGHCEVNGRGGDNTLVAMRGIHTLNSGSGQGAYELHGPSITDFIVISVTKGRDYSVTARCANGIWNGSKLSINIIVHDPTEIILTSCSFVDGEGQVSTGMGTISIGDNKQNIVFEPGTDFNFLKRNQTETVRVQYVSKGSYAVIQERTMGNRIKLHGFSNKSELVPGIALNGDLYISNSQRELIFKDTHFGDLYRAGFTNLNTLLIDFAARFPTIQFNGSDADNIEINKTEVFDFLSSRLRYMKTGTNSFDNLYDWRGIGGNQVMVFDGDNFVYGRRRRVFYTSGNGNDIFDLTKLGTDENGSMPYTAVRTGAGNDLVAVKSSIADNIHVQFCSYRSGQNVKDGEKTLVFHDVGPNDLLITQNGSGFAFSNEDRVLVETDCTPDLLMFTSSSQHIIIDDVTAYLSQRIIGGDYFYRRIYNEKFEQKLRLEDCEPDDIFLDVAVEAHGLTFTLKTEDELLYNFWVGVPTETTFDARNASAILQLEFKRGIVFANKTVETQGIRKLVMECLRSSNRHSVIGSTDFNQVVRASNVDSPYTTPSGDSLVYADEEDSEIYAGEGNNVIKVSASNQIVNTGRTRDSAEGLDIVQILEGLSNVTVQFKAREDSHKVGSKYMILDGVSCDTISFEDTNGNPLTSYTNQSDPFVVKAGDRIVARFDSPPTSFLFRRFDGYEMVDFASYFVRRKVESSWTQRFLLNNDMKVVLLAEDINSRDLYFTVKKYFKSMDVLFKTDRIREVLELEVNLGGSSHVRSSDLAKHIALHISGGIRFRDRTIHSIDELVTFLEEALLSPNTQINSFELQRGESETTVEELLRTEDPHMLFKNAVMKSKDNITITNIDEPEEESFPEIIQNATYPSPPSTTLKKTQRKMAIHWKGRTYYWYDYKSRRKNEFALIGFDEDGNRKRINRKGVRYCKSITKNDATGFVRFTGEKNRQVWIKYSVLWP